MIVVLYSKLVATKMTNAENVAQKARNKLKGLIISNMFQPIRNTLNYGIYVQGAAS
jgi:hypothetical protein